MTYQNNKYLILNNSQTTGKIMLKKFLSTLLLFCLVCSSVMLSESIAASKKRHKKIAQLEFRDITVGDALKILSEQSDMNIIASKKAAKIQMTMFLHDVLPKDVLDAMSKTYNLWYQKDYRSGIVRVYTVQEFRLGLVDYKNEKTKIFTFKHERNALDFAYIIRDLYGEDRVKLSRGSDESDILNNLSDRMERFDIIASNTMDLGGSGETGSFGLGGSNGNSNSNNRTSNNNQNTRNSNNSRGNNRSGQRNNIDSNKIFDSQKIMPESESNAAFSGDFYRGKGAMDQFVEQHSPIYVTMIRQQNRVLVRTRDKDAMGDLKQLYKDIDTELATLLLEIKLLQIDLSDGYDSVFDFSMTQDNHNVSTVSEGSDITGQQVADLVMETALGISNPALIATYVGKKFISRIELLEKEGRVTALATPMLNTVNQEISRIFIGEQRPITTKILVVCGTAVTTTNTQAASTTCRDEAQTDIIPIGRTILLTPNINSNNTVSIRLLVEDSSVCEKCASIPTQDGGKTVDTVQQETFGGTVIASDQQMIAVGGLIEERSSDVEDKVPFFGDIPLLGILFTKERRVRKRTELVILLRPFIMNNNAQRTTTNNEWLQNNSVHPNAKTKGNGNMDIYSNPEGEHKGYKLEKPYSEYQLQDTLDSLRWDNPPNPR
ncbi:MAG: hypothetical protein KAT04_04575 [Methylococcales bacterium]|nr:hypothetical protein [Methylococcales bacterium]